MVCNRKALYLLVQDFLLDCLIACSYLRLLRVCVRLVFVFTCLGSVLAYDFCLFV